MSLKRYSKMWEIYMDLDLDYDHFIPVISKQGNF